MCDKATLENGGTLKSVPECYKNQEVCNKAVDNYPHALESILECCKTQKMWSCWYLSFYNEICTWILYDSRLVW